MDNRKTENKKIRSKDSLFSMECRAAHAVYPAKRDKLIAAQLGDVNKRAYFWAGKDLYGFNCQEINPI